MINLFEEFENNMKDKDVIKLLINEMIKGKFDLNKLNEN
jgi:hypothetical protein